MHALGAEGPVPKQKEQQGKQEFLPEISIHTLSPLFALG